MTLYLTMSKAIAEQVRGAAYEYPDEREGEQPPIPLSSGHAINPRPLADGETYVVQASLKENPDFVDVHEALAGLPEREIAPEEWPQAEEE